MDDESPRQEWEQEYAIDKEFQDVFSEIENDEAKKSPEQLERERSDSKRSRRYLSKCNSTRNLTIKYEGYKQERVTNK